MPTATSAPRGLTGGGAHRQGSVASVSSCSASGERHLPTTAGMLPGTMRSRRRPTPTHQRTPFGHLHDGRKKYVAAGSRDGDLESREHHDDSDYGTKEMRAQQWLEEVAGPLSALNHTPVTAGTAATRSGRPTHESAPQADEDPFNPLDADHRRLLQTNGHGFDGLLSSTDYQQTFTHSAISRPALTDHQRQQAALLDRLQGVVKELRTKYHGDRLEMMHHVNTHVSDVKVELEMTRQRQNAAYRDVETSARQLAALERFQLNGSSSGGGDISSSSDLAKTDAGIQHAKNITTPLGLTLSSESGLPEVCQATVEASHRLDALRVQLQQCRDQNEQLRSALIGDRLRREDRRKIMEEEDRALDERIKQVEDSTSLLQHETHMVRSLNAEVTGIVTDVVMHCKPDPAAVFSLSSMSTLQQAVQSDLQAVRAEQQELVAKVDALKRWKEKDADAHGTQVRELEAAIRLMEDVKQPVAAPSFINTMLLRQSLPTDVPSQPLPSALHRSTNSIFAAPGGNPQMLTAPSMATPSRPSSTMPIPPIATRPLPSAPPPPPLVMPQQHLPVATQEGSFADQIRGFYRKYNPTKDEHSIAMVLQEYEGAEEELMAALEVHYQAFGYFS